MADWMIWDAVEKELTNDVNSLIGRYLGWGSLVLQITPILLLVLPSHSPKSSTTILAYHTLSS